MTKTGAKASDIADAAGKSTAAVYGWLGGEYRPDGDARDRLERFTDGRVPAEIWLTSEEREKRDAVKPFVPARDSQVG